MGSLHDPPALRKRPYISPVFMVRGDIATLTQQTKTIGLKDGIILVPNPNVPDLQIPLVDLS